MSSKVTIWNMALVKAGSKHSIQSETEQSKEADYCNALWDNTRKKVLEAVDWNFARKRVALATLADTIPGEWAYVYQYPTDCLQVRFVGQDGHPYLRGTGEPPPFMVGNTDEGNYAIFSDIEDAYAYYTFDLEDTNRFSSLFESALAWLMAAELQNPLTGKRDRHRYTDIMDTYRAEIAIASATNRNEGQSDKDQDGDLIRARV